MNDKQLEQMSVKELLELQASIHTAIRAKIRAINERRGSPPDTVVTAAPAAVDLESERNAWLAARKK